jgi:hypothetical protein
MMTSPGFSTEIVGASFKLVASAALTPKMNSIGTDVTTPRGYGW